MDSQIALSERAVKSLSDLLGALCLKQGGRLYLTEDEMRAWRHKRIDGFTLRVEDGDPSRGEETADLVIVIMNAAEAEEKMKKDEEEMKKRA